MKMTTLFDKTVYQMIKQRPNDKKLEFITTIINQLNQEKYDVEFLLIELGCCGYEFSNLFIKCIENLLSKSNEKITKHRFLVCIQYYIRDHPFVIETFKKLNQKSFKSGTGKIVIHKMGIMDKYRLHTYGDFESIEISIAEKNTPCIFLPKREFYIDISAIIDETIENFKE
jgi:hypothetical protein